MSPPPPLIFGINTAHAQTDTTAPTAVFGDIANGVIGTEQSVLLTFSEAVTDLTASDFSTSTGVTGIRVSDPDSDQITYTIAFTPSSQAIVLRLAANSVMDTAAIPNEGPVRLVEQALRATDPDMPSLVGTYASIAAGEINTRQMLTFTFSEPVTGLTTASFTLGGGVLNSITPSSGYHTIYTLTLTPTTTGQVVLRLLANSVTDRDGNTGPGIPATLTTFSLGAPDTTAPTVDFGTIDVGVIGTRQTHTISFNQIVTGFAATDITATGATVNSLSGSGDTYMITFTPTLTSFTLTLAADSVSDTAATPNTGPATEPAAARSVTGTAVLSADADLATLSITDNNGNPVTPNEAIAPDTLTYTATAPSDTTSVTITVTAADSNAEVDLDSLGTNTENFGFRDAMQSFAIEITAPDGTMKLYRLTITRAVILDTTAPTATFGTIDVGVIGTQQTVGLTFDEAVTGLEAGDFSTSTGVTGTSVSGSGDTYNITFTPSETSFTLTLAVNSVEDTAATPNAGPAAAATATGTAVDTTAPTADWGTIAAGVVGTAQTHDITFSEAVTGLAADDITATGATVDSVSGSGSTYTITFTPSETSFTLTLAADSVEDTASTPNAGPVSAASATGTAVPADTTAPTVDWGTIAVGVVGTAQTHDLTFSEVVTGLAATDITATGATVDSVGGSGDTYTITFTPNAAAFTLTLAADSVEDTAATPNPGPAAAATATGTAVDTTAPEITLIGASPLEVEHGSTFTDPGATASDGVDGDLSARIVVGGDPVDTDTPGDYTITYDVSDAAANAAETVTRIVRVVIVRDLAKLNKVILPEVARSMTDQHVSAIVRRLEQARRANIAGTAASSSFGGAGNLTDIIKAQGRALVDDQFDWKRVLAGSAFVLPLNGAGGGAAEKAQDFTLWGAGDYRSIEGADGVRWDGNLFSLQLGLDAQLNAHTILGVAISKSQARLDYTDPSLAVSGDYDLDMTSVHPYLGWVAGGLDFWATLGYGDGELDISEDRALGEAIPSSDLSMQTFALGASGILMETGLTTLGLKGEAMSSTVELDGNEQITAVTRDASRLRMTLEATRAQSLDTGAQFESSLEAGMRYDGGDGETGAGAELGASLRYARLGGGLVIEGKARALVGGEAEEWGLSGAISFQPSTNGRGLSFSLTPGYGVTTGGVQQLWQQGLDDGLGGASHGASNEYSPRLKVRLDYGMHALRGPGLMTPYTELSLGDKRTYRLGMQWQHSKLFDLKFVAERKEGTTAIDHRIYLEGELAF